MFGTVHLLQRRVNSVKTKLNVMLDGLDELPGDDEYGFVITEYPSDYNTVNPCAPAIVGDLYNPEGIDISLADYSNRCQDNHAQCAIGDLATRHRPLTGNDTNTLVGLKDCNLNLNGPNTVVGRGMSLKRLDTDETLACCNIKIPANARILRAAFNNGVFSGEITIILPQYDYLYYTRNKNTIISVDLERIDGGVGNIPMLQWNLRRGIADSSCSNLRPPFHSSVVSEASECSQTNHRACTMGDLTRKCGPLRLVNNRIRAQCTDNQLGLTSFSTLNRLAVSIDQGLTILDCAQLSEQEPAGAYVNFRFDRTLVNLAFTQPSPQDPTMYRSYIIGLNGEAGNIVVYDGKDCDNLGDVLNYPGELPTGNPVTGDEFAAGELGPKMGGVIDKDYLHTKGLSSNIPLTGPVNIIDKPITVLRKNGTVWGCGMVQDYYNMPYEPPEDVNEYLELLVIPTP